MSFAQKLGARGAIPLHKIVAKDAQGRDCWFFLIAPKRAVDQLAARTEGTSNLHEIGEVIASGWGREPDEATLERMRTEYDWRG